MAGVRTRVLHTARPALASRSHVRVPAGVQGLAEQSVDAALTLGDNAPAGLDTFDHPPPAEVFTAVGQATTFAI